MRTCLLIIALMGFNAIPDTAAQTTGDVCYDQLGCFSMAAPWFSAMRPLPKPQTPAMINTQFHLYTRTQPLRYVVTKLPSISFTGSDYLGSRPTFFLVQGFLSNGNMSWILAMKDALLKEFDANVIIVDWRNGSTQLNYLQVASNTRVVGAELLRLAKFLVSNMGAAVTRFHIIGHSLGAHVAGYVGKGLPGIARITGLDVAQPGFEGYPALVRLNTTDALFVEAIHTSARPLVVMGMGYVAPIGHVDYYVNGGAFQPGCVAPPTPNVTIATLADLGKVTVEVLAPWIFCHHARAFHVFTASVANKNCIFWGHRVNSAQLVSSLTLGLPLLSTFTSNLVACSKDTCSPLGLQSTIYPARGVFVVVTTGTDPYCKAEPKSDTAMSPFKTQPTAAI